VRKQLSVDVSEEVYSLLNEACRGEKISISNVVCDILEHLKPNLERYCILKQKAKDMHEEAQKLLFPTMKR
jgi:predicted CopG family antitoxin